MNIFSNYPDIIATALIPMIIAVFALGFPLLIQTITRIDDKYKSTILIKTFRKDWICQYFLIFLFCAIASYILWFLQIPPLFELGWIIDNSALILVIVSTIALIAMTFLIVYLTYVYYLPELLLNRLIKQYEKRNENVNNLYIQAISKILKYSIQTIDESLADKLWEFYFSKIIKLRKNKENQEIIYPKEFYITFLEVNEFMCEQNKRAISRFNNNSIFDLFLDGYQQTIISQETYSFLWKIVLQSLHYNREDFVMSYWRKAHQLFNFFIKEVYPDYDYSTSNDGKLIAKNQYEVDKRKKERYDFLEFHYALGALLMYKQKYSVLKETMYYTQQQPPKYVLVPEKMQEIIERYMQIDSSKYINPVYYEQKYQFPDIYGINSEGTIRMWFKKYLAILFIRQYSLPKFYINSNHLTMPPLPDSLSELNRWKEELKGLEYYINDYLSQNNVLENLGMDMFCNQDWFEKNDKEKPSVLIDNYIKKIEDKFKKIKEEQPIDKSKEKEFKENTVAHLTPIFNKYVSIFSNKQINNYRSHYIRGRTDILAKAAFAENQDMAYMNSDSITAQGVAIEFEYYASNTFVFMSPQKYFLKESEVFFAIDNLNINSEDFLIISIGLNLSYYKHLKIEELEIKENKWFYRDFEIIEINNYNNDYVSQSLFVLRKTDLPNIIFKETNKELIEKYKLEKIDNIHNIYGKIIDLNNPENKIIKEEIEQNNDQTDLSESVLSYVNINVEIQYRIDVKSIQLISFSQFDDRGKANKIEDIESFDNE
jgi:hypothetical protein